MHRLGVLTACTVNRGTTFSTNQATSPGGGQAEGPGGRARQSLDGGALVFANRNPRVATVNDLASLVRHEKPPARAAPISTPRVSEASSNEESARVVTPPACPGGPAPTPSDRPWTLDVGSLLREAAQAAASGAS